MSRVMGLGLVLVLVCGSAWATDYTYIGLNQKWKDATLWDVGGTYPSTASDFACIPRQINIHADAGVPFTMTVGKLVIDNDAYVTWKQSGTNQNTNTITVDNSVLSGDFLFNSGNWMVYHTGMTLNVYGNMYLGMTFTGSGPYALITNLDGPGKYIGRVGSTSNGHTPWYINVNARNVYDNNSMGSGNNGFAANNGEGNTLGNLIVTVAPGASIGADPTGGDGWWKARRFVFQGGQANLPALGAKVDFVQGYIPGTDNGPGGKVWVTAGVTYPRDLIVGHPWSNKAQMNAANLRLAGGDLGVGRDLMLSRFGNSSFETWLDTVDNSNTSVSRNITVKQDFYVGASSIVGDANSATDRYGFRANGSTVTVGRDFLVSNGRGTGTLDMGNGTFYLGRDFIVEAAPVAWALANWSPGASTVICTGNGTAPGTGQFDQTLRTRGDAGIALGSLVVRNDCGTVSLHAANSSGDLILAGDLRLETGKFDESKRLITFNGPDHHIFWDNVNCVMTGVSGNNLDCIVLAPDAVLTLDSFINTDNIDMQAGSKLYLSGFTLLADSKRFVSGLISDQGIPYDEGTIFGTLSTEIPEPATLLLLGTGALGAIGWVRRRRMS